jgi:GalNAc-alpha-(1->4)-GalNAc-alpha-(1->3)-diNAcBac-PP-undecaprenol alpha-1,4-N-acetyl-D-galactosaminyltransferase
MNDKDFNYKEKHIVFVVNTLHEGGAAKILSWLANNTIKYYKRVSIVTFFSSVTAIKLDERINVVAMENFKRTNKPSMFWRLSLVKNLRKTILDLKPDLVCSFISDVNVTSILALFFSKIPLIVAERGDPYTLSKSWKLITKILYKSSNYRIYQTDMAQYFFEKKKKAKSKIIPNPYIETGIVSPYQGKRNNVISSAGRFEYQKGFDVLLRAFRIVSTYYPDYELVIYGEGSLREYYSLMIKELKLSTKVKMPGYVSNLQEKIRGDKLFVLPSRFEGMPNALMEAMAIGIPTVSTDCTPGGPAYLTKDGTRGVLVKVDDVESLAEGIVKVISDEELSNKLSVYGQDIKNELNPEYLYQKWKEVFDGLVVTQCQNEKRKRR